VDALGANRKGLNEDAENVRFCLAKKTASLSLVRQAVGKVITMMQEERDNPLLDSAAANSVIAGMLGYFCQ
jgi:hypothetical protein